MLIPPIIYAINLIYSFPSADLIELLENNIPSFRGPDHNDDNIFDTLFSDYDQVVGEIKPDEKLSSNQFACEIEENEDLTALVDLNREYQAILITTLQSLEEELKHNQRRQRELDQEILNCSPDLEFETKEDRHRIITKGSLSIFAYPYFKDQHLYSHPSNEDTRKKRNGLELDVWINDPKIFSYQDRITLKELVKEDAVRKKSSRLRLQQIAERDVLRQLEEVSSLPDDVLFANRYEEYDWERISVEMSRLSSRSSRACQLQWQNRLHPSVNVEPFSKREDDTLRKFAMKKSGDWDLIATELGTGRTAIACFVRVMTRHSVNTNNRDWHHTEDLRLKTIVSHCRLGNFIPWAKVSFFMERRDRNQCQQRFVNNLRDNTMKGCFSPVEDMLLILGNTLFQRNWSKIQEVVPTRTPMQLHSRFSNFLESNASSWSEEEDRTLLQQIKKHGLGDWVKVSQELNRTRIECNQRFRFLTDGLRRNSWFGLSSILYQEKPGLGRKRQEEIQKRLSEEFCQWKEEQGISDQGPGPEVKLPDGEIVDIRSLKRFISHLQTSLPSPPPPQSLPPLVKSSVPVSAPERLIKIPVLMKQPSVKRKARSEVKKKTVVVRRRQKKRPSEVSLKSLKSLKSQTDRSISKLFKSTWFIENKLSWTDVDLEMLAAGGLSLGKIINISKIPWTGTTRPETSPDNKETAVFERIRTKYISGNNNSLHVPTLPSSQSYKPAEVVKTYGRKARTGEKPRAREEKCEKIDLVPPCLSTLVGYRGLLARTAEAEPDRQPDQRSLVVSEEHRAADQLLTKRFIQMFLWPALMASVHPPEQETLFSDSEEDEDVIVLD